MEGTGWRAKVSDIRMAVKTGTAQMVDPKTRMYSDKDFIASTLGIFPADSPRVALYVVLVKPRGVSYLGGQIAAPVLRAATEATISCIDLERGKTLAVVHEGAVTIPPAREVGIGEVMPDLTGFSKKELLPLLVRKDLRVVIEGNGYVVSQKPLVGTKLAEGAAITLRLE
jgi:cell division protein FtsI (penicillin-binding protein 3)